MKLIPLTKGYFTQVDDEDYEWLRQWKWYALVMKNGVYAYRGEWNSKRKNNDQIAMHRIIMAATNGLLVDHKDRDSLNNQRHNLRFCTKQENNRNRCKTERLTTSKYIGVGFVIRKCRYTNADKELIIYQYSKWVARIKTDKISKHIGYFETEKEAAVAYNIAASQMYGEFANLNVVD